MAVTRQTYSSPMVVGTVIHGAAFSKHFAAFSLAVPSSAKDKDEEKDATGPYSPSPSPSPSARAATSTDTEELAVDVVLAAKDGWGVCLLRELCEALSLPGATTASSSSSTVSSGEGEPADMMTTTTEVEIVHATNEALQEEEEEEEESGDENSGLTSISLAEHPPQHPVVIPRRRRYCLHPTELRVRRRRRSTSYSSAPADEKKNIEGKGGGGDEVDDSCACASSSSSSWQTWRACPTSATAAAAAATPTASSSRDGKKNNVVNNKSHWHKIKKDNRASTFAALLVREIGLDRLRRGSGVVDVAGGSGELSFELAVRWGVPCTVIDPRGQGVVLTSRHKRLLASRAANASMITPAWKAASPLARQLAREWGGFTPANAGHVKRWFDASMMNDPTTAALIRDCSAVVGLHPDQATGAIVDCGLVLNKPWAVVPCCVFPSLFPGRLRPGDGTQVRTTEALVEHLMARATEAGAGAGAEAGARRCELPCEGASTAVWWCPPPTPPFRVSPSVPAVAVAVEEAEEEEVFGRDGDYSGVAGGVVVDDVEKQSTTLCGREDWPWPSAPPTAAAEGDDGPRSMGPFRLPSEKSRKNKYIKSL